MGVICPWDNFPGGEVFLVAICLRNNYVSGKSFEREFSLEAAIFGVIAREKKSGNNHPEGQFFSGEIILGSSCLG